MEDSIFVYELFNKIGEFPFLIVCIFHLFRNISRASEAQVGNRNSISLQFKNLFQWNPLIFNKYQSSCAKVIKLIMTK